MVLAGCSGAPSETAPAALPPVVATGTPSQAASAPATTQPPTEPFTADGAAAFVRRYVNALNAAILANDSRSLQAFSSPECTGCQRYIDSIDDMAAKGARIGGQGLSVKDVVPSELQGGEVTVVLDFSTSEYVASAPDGSTIVNLPAEDGLSATLRCAYRENAWRVMDFVLLARTPDR